MQKPMENPTSQRQLNFVSERKKPAVIGDPSQDALSNPEKHAFALSIAYTWGGGGGGVDDALVQLADQEPSHAPILCPCGV